jgi:hypothetical protein
LYFLVEIVNNLIFNVCSRRVVKIVLSYV